MAQLAKSLLNVCSLSTLADVVLIVFDRNSWSTLWSQCVVCVVCVVCVPWLGLGGLALESSIWSMSHSPGPLSITQRAQAL